MKRLFFVTPAYQRYELSKICFSEQKWMHYFLSRYDIEARSVIVADDENLDIARDLEFDILEHDNEWLGKRRNAGIEYAVSKGADYICTIDSDSWIDPRILVPLPEGGAIHSGHWLSAFSPTGDLRLELWIDYQKRLPQAVGPYVVPIKAFEHLGYRPCYDEIKRGVDHSTFRQVNNDVFPFEMVDYHPLQYLTFKSPEDQVTGFNLLDNAYVKNRVEENIFKDLFDYYPDYLVIAIMGFYNAGS